MADVCAGYHRGKEIEKKTDHVFPGGFSTVDTSTVAAALVNSLLRLA